MIGRKHRRESSRRGTETTLGKTAIAFALALLIIFALSCRMTLVEGDGSVSQPWRFLSMLADSFYYSSTLNVLAFAAVFIGVRRVLNSERGCDVWTLALSAVFGALFVVAMKLSGEDKSLDFFIANSFQRFLSLFCVIGYILLFYFILRLLFQAMERPAGSRPEADLAAPKPGLLRGWQYRWRFGFVLISLCWLPWIILNYPGTFSFDTTGQIMQFFGNEQWSAHHPPLSTAIMGGCMYLGRLVCNVNLGCFFYELLQLLLGAAVLSYSIKKIRDMGAENTVCLAALLFFAFSPLLGAYAQWIEKDMLYAQMSVVCVVLFADTVRRRTLSGREALTLSALVLLAALLRNNGIYELLPAMLLLLIYLRKADRRRMAAALCAVLLIFGGITKLLYPALGIEPGSIKEALSIPFQQTALYVNTCGDEVTQEERAVIDSVLDYDKLGEYDPVISDPIKRSYRYDDSKLPEYFRVWFQMLLKHPGIYVEAFLLKSYGFFAPYDQSFDPLIITYTEPKITELGITHPLGEAGAAALNSIKNLCISSRLGYVLLMPGLYAWILLACFVLLLKHRKYGALIPLTPGLMNFLVCLASPRSTSMRYALPMLLIALFIIGWTRIHVRAEAKSE